MTMHLVGPYLSTTGKKKGKQKFRSAEQARKSRENEEQWAKKQKEWEEMSAARAQDRAKAAKPLRFDITPPRGNSSIKNIPSVDTGKGDAFAKDVPVYTGDSMLGVVIMHKSCLQPVFNKEAATDAANMRR